MSFSYASAMTKYTGLKLCSKTAYRRACESDQALVSVLQHDLAECTKSQPTHSKGLSEGFFSVRGKNKKSWFSHSLELAKNRAPTNSPIFFLYICVTKITI